MKSFPSTLSPLSFPWLIFDFLFTGTRRIPLKDVLKQLDLKSLVKQLTEQVNQVVPGYDWKVVPKDPDAHLGLMVSFLFKFGLKSSVRFNCIGMSLKRSTSNRSILMGRFLGWISRENHVPP